MTIPKPADRAVAIARLGALACPLLLGACLLGACTPPQPEPEPAAQSPASAAPPPQDVPEPDPSVARTERAAPPELEPLVLGEFEPADPVAESTSGRLSIEDAAIVGDNGARFTTERIAIVRGGDEYRPGERYSEAMLIGAQQPVELRRVVKQTAPGEADGQAICGNRGVGFLALAQVVQGSSEVVRLLALSGKSVPAAGARDIALCGIMHYTRKL